MKQVQKFQAEIEAEREKEDEERRKRKKERDRIKKFLDASFDGDCAEINSLLKEVRG